ncbi:MAG: O-antigen ligase family protein [Anaerolineae bacterium]|nr:O-antigen ligase family protein [Anaerolineae bacterium]
MRERTNLLAWALLMLLSLYLAFVGIAAPIEVRFKNVALALGAIALAAWAVARWRGKWGWHSTPLDGLALLWLAVITVSTLANFETWRRSAIGMWYIGMYIAVWLVLWDCMANRALSRSALVDALLISSLVTLFHALREIVEFISEALQALAEGLMLPALPRPVANLGNANLLAAYLILIIPLSAARWLTVQRGWQRLALSAHFSLALIVLLLTYSRSHWLGIAVAGALFALLLLAHAKAFNLSAPHRAWQRLSERAKVLIGTLSLAGLVIVSALIAFGVRSLSDPSRTLDLRTYIYDVAWQVFEEQPLTGNGLFTFGSQLARLSSVPPRQIHAHAHSAFFNIAAELGALGLFAFALSLIVLLMSLRRQWQTLQGEQRLLMIGASAALSASFVSHLTDFTIFTVLIALMTLVNVLVALFPAQPARLSAWRARLNSVGVLALVLALYVSGIWSNVANGEYLAALQTGVGEDDWQASRVHFERAIALDPQLSLYYFYYGHVLGVAAARGEIAPQPAIEAYQTFVRQEPNYAAAWANLAALHWQAGNQGAALSAMQRAAEMASQSWLFHFALGTYYEQLNDQEAARRAFERALTAQPSAALYPAWQETPLRRELAQSTEIPPSIDAVARLLRNRDLPAAESLWRRVRWTERAALLFLIDAVIALERGDIAQAERACRQVERIPPDDAARESWHWLCRAYLAHLHGDAQGYAEARRALDSYTQHPFDSPMDKLVSPIGYSLFLRIGISQYLLPQVYNPPLPPSFYALYDHLKAFTAR